MNSPPHESLELWEDETAVSLSRFDRRLAAGFGALVLLLMIVVSLVATYSNRQIAQTHEEVLSSALTGILAESINRSSFSGRYHTRRLLEEITAHHPQLRYVYVADGALTIVAHSDPAQNDQTIPPRLVHELESVMRDHAPRFSRQQTSTGMVQEIVMPYYSGYEREITGVIVVGISLRDIRSQATNYWIRLVLLIALLTIISLVATFGLSRYLANPVRQMAHTLQGILRHAPVYIGLFRNPNRVEQVSDSTLPLLRLTGTAGKWPFYAADDTAQHPVTSPTVGEVPFQQDDDTRTAAVTTFSVEPNADVDAPLLCSIAMDITEQRRAEAALREHRDQLEATVQERTGELEEAYTLLRQREREIITLSNLRGALLRGGSFAEQCQAITDTTATLLGSRMVLIWEVAHTPTIETAPANADEDDTLRLAAQTSAVPIDASTVLQSDPIVTFLSQQTHHVVTEGPFDDWTSEQDITALYMSRLVDPSGALIGLLSVYATRPFTPRHLAILEDITTTSTYIIQAQRALMDLQHANKSLIKQERLATLGELTATVSHELRNPLGIISASFFSIQRELADSDDLRVKRMLERGSRGVQRCDRIIEELLSFTRATTLRPERTMMDRWLREELATYAFDEDILVVTDLQPDVQVAVDRQALYQCLVNLLNNACDALRESDSENKRIRIVLKRENTAILLSIHDSGPGIDSDTQKQLFEPLFSTKGFGTGLGLALVQKLITLHGGRIAITSEPGKGTTATLTIPATDQGL